MPRDVAVRMSGLSKSFGSTRALDGADVVLRRGTVHALLGGNGSGKSTAIKILAGVYSADAGVIEMGGSTHDCADWSPAVATSAGLRFVHQDLGLFDQLSIAENFALDAGYPIRRTGGIRWARLDNRAAALLERFEIRAHPRQPVATLRPAQRSMLAIARALQDDDGDAVLVLDEPTATLPAHESELLLRAIRRRADLGQTIMMVSHRMAEVLSVAHEFTVFRDGRTVATIVEDGSQAAPTEEQLVALMTGQELGRTMADHEAPQQVRERVHVTDTALRVEGLAGGPLKRVDLEVRAGEIVGVTGLVGSGRTSLLKTIFGQHPSAAGAITIGSRRQKGTEDSHKRMAQGVAYVAEDRVAESSFMELSIRENLSVSVLRRFWRSGRMAAGEERRSTEGLIARHGVRAAGPEAAFSSLSGGNQQKAILGRWLRRKPSLILLDEPTQGVDVMSRKQIYDTIHEVASDGCAVLVASSDFIELATLCDRVVVLAGGIVATELSGEQLTVDHLTAVTQSSTISQEVAS